MDPTTKLIKEEIMRQYDSLYNFAKACGIPYSTLSTALRRGIEFTSYSTVIIIMDKLGIKNTSDDIRMSAQAWDLMSKISELDRQGLYTVNAIVNAEYSRCTQGDRQVSKPKTEKAYNGIGIADRRGQEAIKKLVREVLNEKSD